MKWDVFSPRKPRDKRLEEIRKLAGRIEKFAPPRYKGERTSRYYNYHTLNPYVQPLLELLQVLAAPERLREREKETVRTLFARLKDFYDVKGRLLLSEALEDERLLRKMEEILLIFFDRPDLRKETLRGHLKGMGDGDS